MRREHRHVDELRAVGPSLKAGADVADGRDVAVRRLDAHAEKRRILHQVLPVAPLLRAALFHPVLLAVALHDELVAVAILELTRAVARRKACAQTKHIGNGHSSLQINEIDAYAWLAPLLPPSLWASKARYWRERFHEGQDRRQVGRD